MSQEAIARFEEAVIKLQSAAKHGTEESGFDTPQFARMMFEVADVLELVECKQIEDNQLVFVVGDCLSRTYKFPFGVIRMVLAAIASFVCSQNGLLQRFEFFNVYGDSKEVELSIANGGSKFHVETLNSRTLVYRFSIRKIGASPLGFVHLDARLARFVARHGASAFGAELVGEGEERGHVTASARIWNAKRTHFLQVWSAKNGRWQLPGAHGEGDFDLHSVALREARRALGLAPDAQLNGGEVGAVLKQRVEEYWNTPAHWHLEVVFEFHTTETNELPNGARWNKQ